MQVGKILKDFLLETAAVTLASTAILSALAWFLTPRVRSFIWNTISNDTTQYDRLRVESFSRQTAAGKEVVRLMLVKELEQLEGLRSVVEDHTSAIEFVHNTVMKQAEEMQKLPSIAQAIQASAQSVSEIAKTMKEIHGEVIAHGKKLAGWDGYFDGKSDGEEGQRRRHKRRHNDNDPDDL